MLLNFKLMIIKEILAFFVKLLKKYVRFLFYML